jgi:hypothetical protein
MLRTRIAPFALTLVLSLTGCSSTARQGSETVTFGAEIAGDGKHGQMNQAQLQDALLRFQSSYTAGLRDSLAVLNTSDDPVVREQALLFEIRNISASLDLVVNPIPQANLLDLVAYIELETEVVKTYWVPRVFHHDGLRLQEEYERSRHQIWALAGQLLTPAQQAQLLKIITDWRKAHPDQVVMAGVQLSNFAAEAGSEAQADQKAAGGLFAEVSKAVSTTDEARLLGERALHYAKFAQLLTRLHVRLTAMETFQDMGLQFSHLPETEARLTALLREMKEALEYGDFMMRDATSMLPTIRQIVASNSEHPQALHEISTALGHLAQVAKEWNRMAAQPKSENAVTQMAGVAAEAQSNIDRVIVKTFWLALAWLAFALTGGLAAALAWEWAKHRMGPP